MAKKYILYYSQAFQNDGVVKYKEASSVEICLPHLIESLRDGILRPINLADHFLMLKHAGLFKRFKLKHPSPHHVISFFFLVIKRLDS